MPRPMRAGDLMPFFIILAVIAGLTLCMSSWLLYVKLTGGQTEATTLELVQAGKLILRCDLPQGTVDVDPAKITGYYEGQWQFSNGWSSSCILIVRGNNQ